LITTKFPVISTDKSDHLRSDGRPYEHRRLPQEASNGIRYLRVPLNLRKPTNADGTKKG
jgi:hypothetical protein